MGIFRGTLGTSSPNASEGRRLAFWVALSVLLACCLSLLPGKGRKGLSDSVFKFATANPTFDSGMITRGDFTLTRQSDDNYFVVRETGFLVFWFLDSYWSSFQLFTEAPRSKVLSIEVQVEAYQQDSREIWHVQFFDFQSNGWHSSWHQMGAFPTSGKATLTVRVTDASLARRFVGPNGEFRMRLADQGTVSFNFELSRTTLYIDLLRVRFVYDITPPQSTISHPPDNTYTNATAMTITGTAMDQGIDRSGVSSVQVSLDGGINWSAAQPQSPGDFSAWSYRWNQIPSEGTYLIRSRATDGVGNVETPSSGSRVVVDWTPPRVGSVSPPPGGQDVPVNTTVTVNFLEENPMNAASINPATFTVKDEDGKPVPGTVSYDPANKRAVFLPSQPFLYGQTYTVTLGQDIRDLAGNPLSSGYSWTFRTADILLLSVQSTYNRDGNPGGGSVDFGVVTPEGSPYAIGGGNPPFAVSLRVLCSTPWNLYLLASSPLVDNSQGSGVELPVSRLSWALSGSGSFVPLTFNANPAFSAFQAKTPQPGGRTVNIDLRLEVRWEDQPGYYSGGITFILLSGP